MLKKLQNNVNYVYSGLAVITKKDGRVIEKNDYTKTAVYIKKMTEKEIKEKTNTKLIVESVKNIILNVE